MVNKKILFLIFVGIFFVLLLNSFVGADWQQKVDWAGNAFDWCDVGTTSHDVEYCGYSYYGSDIYEYACDEDGNFKYNNCVDNTKCFQASVGSSYKIAYIPIPGSPPIWYSAKCKGASHNVGRHFANMFGGTDNDVGDYEYYQPYPKFATITCTDTDGDGVSRSGGACGQVESTACDRDSFTYGIYSVSTEICGDGKDNDCNGAVDNGCDCIYGSSPSRSCDAPGECSFGTQTCTQPGQWSPCSIAPTTETCDGKDNNCDGAVDIDLTYPLIDCAIDRDEDFFGIVEGISPNPNFMKDICSNAIYGWCPRKESNNYWDFGAPNDWRRDDWLAEWRDDWTATTSQEDCDDDNPNNFPGNTEICDLKDNNCNNIVNENPNYLCPTSGQICISGTCKTPRTYWASNSIGTNEISAKVFAPSPTQTVYLVLEYPPFGVSNWEFEIYDKDGLFNSDDEIRVGANALSGIVSGNKVIATWTITEEDIDNAGIENTYEFYFKVKEKEIGGGGGEPQGPIA